MPRIYRIERFLDPREHDMMVQTVCAHNDEFVPAGVYGHFPDRRKSTGPRSLLGAEKVLFPAIRAIAPDVLEALGVEIKPSRIEGTLIAHNDGDYFDMHIDNGMQEIASRAVTFVYYFARTPERFDGGETVIYDTVYEDHVAKVLPGEPQVVRPIANSIVFFSSYYLHKVRAVSCPSKRFEDGRFGINGWIHRHRDAAVEMHAPPWDEALAGARGPSIPTASSG